MRVHSSQCGMCMLCVAGVYHAAANTLSLAALHAVATRGETVEAFLCKHQHVWGERTVYFDRCAAGLGMIDAEHRMAKVASATCKRDASRTPDEWERNQLAQFGPTLQLSCNPASTETGFTVVMGTCPQGFRLHFPCDEGSPDYKICTGELFGMDVTGRRVAFHQLCGGHDVLRKMFECERPFGKRPTRQQLAKELDAGRNVALYDLEYVGAWGGACTCPDGQVFTVGDEGNLCGSVACEGAVDHECYHRELTTERAHRKTTHSPRPLFQCIQWSECTRSLTASHSYECYMYACCCSAH
jgi:hypothetical protein